MKACISSRWTLPDQPRGSQVGSPGPAGTVLQSVSSSGSRVPRWTVFSGRVFSPVSVVSTAGKPRLESRDADRSDRNGTESVSQFPWNLLMRGPSLETRILPPAPAIRCSYNAPPQLESNRNPRLPTGTGSFCASVHHSRHHQRINRFLSDLPLTDGFLGS